MGSISKSSLTAMLLFGDDRMGFEQFIESVGQETIGLKTLFLLALGCCLIYFQYFKKPSKPPQKATLLIPERKLRKKFLLVEDRLDALETRLRKVESQAGIPSPPRFGAADINGDDDDEL